MRQTVFGIFDNSGDAQNAVKHLVDSGFMEANIDLRAKEASASDTTRHGNDGSDSFSSFFSNLFGGDKTETRTYSDVARRGSVVTVHTTSLEESERAAQILDKYGAIDANERAQQYRTQEGRGTTEATAKGADNSIPIIEEELEVGKREVETGNVRVRSRIIERPVEETLRLREEHVNVERKPVDRPATDADFRNFKEGETEMTEHAEVPIVDKEARVVEEVKLKKETKDRERTVRENVRKTDVDVKETHRDTDPNRRDR